MSSRRKRDLSSDDDEQSQSSDEESGNTTTEEDSDSEECLLTSENINLRMRLLSQDFQEVYTGPESEDEIDEDDSQSQPIDDFEEEVTSNLNEDLEESFFDDFDLPPSIPCSLASQTVTPTPITATPLQWIWSSNTSPPDINDFDETGSGWQFSLNGNETTLDYFKMCFPAPAMKICIEESNRYAHQVINAAKRKTKRMNRFKEIIENDILKLLCVRIIMGINKKPKLSHYWSTNSILSSGIVPKIMTVDRFFEIMKYLHFNNNDDLQQGDRLAKINKVWNACTEQFTALVIPGKSVSIDESLVLWKGRVIFKQFIKNKASRFGIKAWSIVDNKTRFVINSFIYSGKGHVFTYSPKDFGYGGAVIMELISPYLHKYRHLYCDNWFTSPNLAYELLQKKTYICGTVQLRRKNMPKVCQKEIKKGEVKVFQANNTTVETWKDKRLVTMISTGLKHEMKEVSSRNQQNKKSKPKSVIDYNANARGIDISDMMLNFYSILRKTHKWSKKMFFHLIDVCIYNAFCIKKSVSPGTTFLDFRIDLIEEIIRFTNVNIARIENVHAISAIRFSQPGKHFLQFNDATKGKMHGSRKCIVCSKGKTLPKKKSRCETVFNCEICRVPLCAVPCFKIYHTKKNF